MSTPLKLKKPMTREEVALLVDLVVKRPAITIKETNAANNKLKEDAWSSLAVEFNKISDQGRSKEQIKLKWDNLKKAARKRVSQLDKDEAEMVPLGDILDRVSDLLGYGKPEPQCDSDWIVVDSVGESCSSTAKKRKTEKSTDETFFDKYKTKFQSDTGKKEGSGVIERNLAIARYYEKKTEKLEIEIQLLKMQLNRQCNCGGSLKVDNQNNDSDIMDRIKKLNGKINSKKLRIKNNLDCRNTIDSNRVQNDCINKGEDSDSYSNVDQSDSKINVYIDIVKQEPE